MPRHTPKEIKKLIVENRQNGMAIKDIVSYFKVPERTVYHILKQHAERGTVSPRKATGRPRLSTSNEDEEIRKLSETDPFKSAKMIKRETQLPLSLQTVRRR